MLCFGGFLSQQDAHECDFFADGLREIFGRQGSSGSNGVKMSVERVAPQREPNI